MTDTTGMVPDKPLLDLIILDCPDALELATFYSTILGWAIEDGSDKDFANLVPPGGGLSPDNPDGRATLSFQRIDDVGEAFHGRQRRGDALGVSSDQPGAVVDAR